MRVVPLSNKTFGAVREMSPPDAGALVAISIRFWCPFRRE